MLEADAGKVCAHSPATGSQAREIWCDGPFGRGQPSPDRLGRAGAPRPRGERDSEDRSVTADARFSTDGSSVKEQAVWMGSVLAGCDRRCGWMGVHTSVRRPRGCTVLGMDTTKALLLSDEQWGSEVLLSHRPFAANQLGHGQYRMSRDDALTIRCIQHSPHALLGSIVINCDHPNAHCGRSRNLRIIRHRAGCPSPRPGTHTEAGGSATTASAAPIRRV